MTLLLAFYLEQEVEGGRRQQRPETMSASSGRVSHWALQRLHGGQGSLALPLP